MQLVSVCVTPGRCECVPVILRLCLHALRLELTTSEGETKRADVVFKGSKTVYLPKRDTCLSLYPTSSRFQWPRFNIERGRFTFLPCLAEVCDLWIYRAFFEKADKSRSFALRFGTNHSSHILCSLKSEEIAAFLYVWPYFLNGCCMAQQRMPLMRGQEDEHVIGFITADPSLHPQLAYSGPGASIHRTAVWPLVAVDGCRFFLRNALLRRRARRRPYQRPPSKTEWGLQREGWRASGASFKHSIAGESIRVNQNCQARNLTFDNKTKQIMQCAFPNSPADIRSTTETAVKRRTNSFQVYPTVCCFLFFLSFFSLGVFNPPPSFKPRISSRSAPRQISLTSHSSLMVLTLMTLVRQEEKKLILLTF